MNDSSRRRNVYAALSRALRGVSVPVEDYTKIRTWVNDELPQLHSPGVTSYVVFGSYRGRYHKSLRLAQYELSKPVSVTALVLGDTPELGLTISGSGGETGEEEEEEAEDETDPLAFLVKFHLLTEFADRNVGIYEKESGGEAVELGLLAREPCFGQTTLLPRDYYGMGTDDTEIERRSDVFAVARHVAFADDLDEDAKKTELRGLLRTAREDGIDVTEHELTEFLDTELAERDPDNPAYSWVHLAVFRRFEATGRCHTWHTERDLRDAVAQIRAESAPQWDLGTSGSGS